MVDDPASYRTLDEFLTEIELLRSKPGKVRVPSATMFRIARDPVWTADQRLEIYKALRRATRGDATVRRLIQSRIDDLESPTVPPVVSGKPWWYAERTERFWLEITDRDVLGSDLQWHCFDASDKRTQAYILAADYVLVEDIVYHYDLRRRAIVGGSVVAGQCEVSDAYWITELSDFTRFGRGLSLKQIVKQRSAIGKRQDAIAARHSAPYYFPFTFGRDGLRVRQTYLAKFPAGVVSLFRVLLNALPVERGGSRPTSATQASPSAVDTSCDG